MKLTDANKLRDYVKEQINPYGKPFDGSAYEFGLKLIKYLENMSTDYDVDKVVEELERAKHEICLYGDDLEHYQNGIDEAIEIVKQGGVSDDVCEWHKVKNGNAYKCNTHAEIHDSRVLDWCRCPYCGKKIKVVDVNG